MHRTLLSLAEDGVFPSKEEQRGSKIQMSFHEDAFFEVRLTESSGLSSVKCVVESQDSIGV